MPPVSIPPISIEITADLDQLVKGLAEATSIIKTWAKTVPDVKIPFTIDSKLFLASVAGLRKTTNSLPPIQLPVAANLKSFLSSMTALKAASKDIPAINIPVQPSLKTFLKDMAGLKASARAIPPVKLPVGINRKTFWAEIALLRQVVRRMPPIKLPVTLSLTNAVSSAIAAAAASKAAGAAASGGGSGTPLPMPTGGGSSGFGLAAILAMMKSGGSKVGGMLGQLPGILGFGTGKGGMFGIGGALPPFGSLGSLAGFGAEHFVGTGLGVAGSAVGAGVGGMLLGGGLASTAAVGMGTDMAGIGQAAGDIKNVYAAQTQLNTAMQQYNYLAKQYGPSSAIAQNALTNLRLAQANLNSVLASFSPVARKAVLSAANTAQQFHTLFDKLTGPAEAVGARIIQIAMQTGEKFLPTIGKYALMNMNIIKKQMMPFMNWLQSSATTTYKLPGLGKTTVGTGGLGIFKNLEALFTKELPNGIKLLSNLFQIFAKTMDIAAQYGGSFVKVLVKLTNHMNSPKSMKGWATEIGKLIGLFKTWMRFFGAVIRLVYELFKPAVGLGQAFIKVLTKIINAFATWAKTSGHNTLHSFFSAHFKEMIDGVGKGLEKLVPFAEGAISVFLRVATVMSTAAYWVFRLADGILGLINKVPHLSQIIGGLVMALFLWKRAGAGLDVINKGIIKGLIKLRQSILNAKSLISRIGSGFSNAFASFKSGVSNTIQNFKNFGSSLRSFLSNGLSNLKSGLSNMVNVIKTKLGMAAAEVETSSAESDVAVDGMGASAVEASGGFDLLGAAMSALAVVAIIAIVYELIKHFGVLHGLLIAGAVAVGGLTIAFIAMDAVPIVMVIAGVILAIAGLVAGIIELVKHWKTVWRDIKIAAEVVWNALKAFLEAAWKGIVIMARAIWDDLKVFLSAVWKGIIIVAKVVWASLKAFFDVVWKGIVIVAKAIWNGLTSFLSGVWQGIVQVAETIWNALSTFLGAVWNGVVKVGKTIWNALKVFLTSVWNGTVTVARTIWNTLKKFFIVVWNAIHRGVVDINHMLARTLSAIWHGILVVGKTIWNGLKNFFEAIWHGIYRAVMDVNNFISRGLAAVWHGVVSVFHTIAHAIVAIFKTIVSALTKAGSWMVHGFINGIKHAWHSAQHFISGIAHDVLHIFSDVWGWLSPWKTMEQAGKDMLEGLKKGAKAGQPGLMSSLGSIAHGVLHAFSDVWGWLSPWKTMEQAGKDMLEGLKKGMKKSHTLNSTIKTVGNSVILQVKDWLPRFTTVGVSLIASLKDGLLKGSSQLNTMFKKLFTTVKGLIMAFSPELTSMGVMLMTALAHGLEQGSNLIVKVVRMMEQEVATSLNMINKELNATTTSAYTAARTVPASSGNQNSNGMGQVINATFHIHAPSGNAHDIAATIGKSVNKTFGEAFKQGVYNGGGRNI